MIRRAATRADGSSPSARSPPARTGSPRPRSRFISERAESTPRSAAVSQAPTVHLRARGVHTASEKYALLQAGSSPSARSPLIGQWHSAGHDRFISERAESTAWMLARSSPATVHLRARGVHEASTGRMNGYSGSSPSARSPPAAGVPARLAGRFISERAESTSAKAWTRSAAAVHLRARGVHPMLAAPITATCGSSPSARSPPPRWTCAR